MCQSVRSPIFGLCSEQFLVLFRIVGFIRSQTRRNSTTSTIAEANLDVTRYIFAPSRLRSTTYRLKHSSDVAFLPCASEDLQDFRQEDLFTMFCYFAPVTRHSFQAMCTMFSRKDFFTLFDGRLRIFTSKTNDEPRCFTSLGGHDGAICAKKHLKLVHVHHLANPYTDLTNFLRETKYFLRETNTVFSDTNNSLRGTKYPVQSSSPVQVLNLPIAY